MKNVFTQITHQRLCGLSAQLQGVARISLSEFELRMKDASIHMRLPRGQLDEIKAEAERRGIPYQRFIRELIQRGMNTLSR